MLVISAAWGAHQSRIAPAPAQLARVPSPRPISSGSTASTTKCSGRRARPGQDHFPGAGLVRLGGHVLRAEMGPPAVSRGSRHRAALRPEHQVNPGQMADIASADGRNVAAPCDPGSGWSLYAGTGPAPGPRVGRARGPRCVVERGCGAGRRCRLGGAELIARCRAGASGAVAGGIAGLPPRGS